MSVVPHELRVPLTLRDLDGEDLPALVWSGGAEHLRHVAGLVQREEIGTNCCYARQDKFWVNDPDGTEWEVYYFHEDAEFNDPRYQDEYDQADVAQCCIAPAAQAAPAEVLTTAPMAFTLLDTAAAPAAEACCSPGSGC